VTSLLCPFLSISSNAETSTFCCNGKCSSESATRDCEVPYTLFSTVMTCLRATDPVSGFFRGDFLGLDVLAAENEQAYNQALNRFRYSKIFLWKHASAKGTPKLQIHYSSLTALSTLKRVWPWYPHHWVTFRKCYQVR
jgi:hypothetical protein